VFILSFKNLKIKKILFYVTQVLECVCATLKISGCIVRRTRIMRCNMTIARPKKYTEKNFTSININDKFQDWILSCILMLVFIEDTGFG